MPATAMSITTEINTFTSNCSIYNEIQFNPPTAVSSVPNCAPTPLPTPVRAVKVSNDKVHIGDAISKNNGSDFRQNMMQQLLSVCPDVQPGSKAGTCDTTKELKIDDIWTSVGGELKKGRLTFDVQDAQYENNSVRDTMLASVVATFAGTAANSCEISDTHWQQHPFDHKQCGFENSIQKRDAGVGAIGQEYQLCKDRLNICNGPNHLNAEFAGFGNPYANSFDLAIDWHLDHNGATDFDKWICEIAVIGVAAIVDVVAPELAAADFIASEEIIELLCDKLAG